MLDRNKKRYYQQGQTLVEFILLMVVIASLSFLFIRTTQFEIAKLWKAYVEVIVRPSATTLEFR